ncbi:hypothetical protein BH10ACT1_BH10ACT1_43470 [soil metagenome]
MSQLRDKYDNSTSLGRAEEPAPSYPLAVALLGSLLARTSPDSPSSAPTGRPRLFAGFMTGIGILHFFMPKPFEQIVPGALGHPRFWVYASGVAELASGALVAMPRTRKLGGWVAAATIVGVYPANIQMALDAGRPHEPASWGAWLRLPFHVPLVAWAVRLARPARPENR